MPYSLLLLLCLLLTAFPTPAPAAPLMLESSSLSARGFLERLDDPQGQLDAAAALASSDWKTLPSSLSAGFVPGVIWVRMQVQASASSPVHWMLMLSNSLLDEATLYDMTGTPREIRSGEAIGRDHWPINYRSPVFALTLTDQQPHVLLLRLKSKNAMSVSVRLMPQDRFAETTSMEYLGYGLYFGIYLVLILFHGFFWRMTQAPESGWYLAYVSFCIGIESLTLGLPQQVLNLPMELSDTLLGCALGLSLPVGVIFAMRQLRLEGYRRLQRVLTVGSLVIGLISALAVLTGHYQIGAPLHQITVLLSIPFFIGLALWLTLTGHRPARYFLLLFGIYYAGIGISFLRNLGYVPTTFFTDNAVAIGALMHMLLMSMRIILHYRWLKEKTRHAEDAFTQLIQNQNAELESRITLRTHELRNEIQQRALLEQELRESLRQEKQIREEQRDFVAMVSHEFRTPLAIIGTSAQQMMRNLAGPRERNERRCQNIHEASKRLMTLVDDYLNHDRMTDGAIELRRAEHDLTELLQGCIGEFPPGRIQLDYRASRRHIHCDLGLLRVALRNLLANADRHAPTEHPVQVQVEDSHRGMQLRVLNAGAEIPADQAPLLFQKYFRGTQSQHSPGAGLGLYLVKRISELHGGTLVLESRGHESPICFHLHLPEPA
ncbi:sensor histidine kinase [Pseudomonas fluorescens]|uniref:sensor histidine kinase n=1 Tax=Pseudomonas fluorescens TaxID=294 RepID=UPI000642420D|nr:sensor histidine kinase [Pseudomonas fluorescens]